MKGIFRAPGLPEHLQLHSLPFLLLSLLKDAVDVQNPGFHPLLIHLDFDSITRLALPRVQTLLAPEDPVMDTGQVSVLDCFNGGHETAG